MKTETGKQVRTTYSCAFKRKVVEEIDAGKFTMNRARDFYDIPGSNTIRDWIIKYGKSHLLPEVVVKQLKDEPHQIAVLKARTKELEAALTAMSLKVLRLESTVAVYERECDGVQEKKTSITSSSRNA